MNHRLPDLNSCTIAVIGLGYVGLPLAVKFAKNQKCCRTGLSLKHRVIGFDINLMRLEELSNAIDRTNEISSSELRSAKSLELTNQLSKLEEADVFIITVPTPIDSAKAPNLGPLKTATSTVALALKNRCSGVAPIIIYESTVYPGATEEVCVPILEAESSLRFNEDFYCGYSPERINPGDNQHKLANIVKVTSGSTQTIANWVDSLYGSIIQAGTYIASSIRVAEAAKVIENTQRDLNIALINELSIIFNKLGIDTLDVLEAAGTKWNFLPFRPGLVGGHCIGVDPYYLTYKAEITGYHPQLVLAGRRINDSMGERIADQTIMQMTQTGKSVKTSSILIMGFTFKENCPDIRNTKVIDVYNKLVMYGCTPKIVDPFADIDEAFQDYNVSITNRIEETDFDCIILAVAHDQFVSYSLNKWNSLLKTDGFIIDLKGIAPRSLNPIRI